MTTTFADLRGVGVLRPGIEPALVQTRWAELARQPFVTLAIADVFERFSLGVEGKTIEFQGRGPTAGDAATDNVARKLLHGSTLQIWRETDSHLAQGSLNSAAGVDASLQGVLTPGGREAGEVEVGDPPTASGLLTLCGGMSSWLAVFGVGVLHY